MVRDTLFEQSDYEIYRHEAVGFEEGDIEDLISLEDISLKNLIKYTSAHIAAAAVSLECIKSLGSFDGYRWIWKYAALKEAGALKESDRLKVLFLEDPLELPTEEIIKENAYILGKYSASLQAVDRFNDFFLLLMNEAAAAGYKDEFVKCAEEMISHKEGFKTSDDWGPVLFLGGEGLCGTVLDTFALKLTEEFKKAGEGAVCLDVGESIGAGKMSKERALRWRLLAAVNPKAVVGFQTDCFAEELSEGLLVGNLFTGKKYQFVFDHPLYICYYLMQPIEKFYAPVLDEDYCNYINEYIDNTKEAFFLPPAGQEGSLVKAGKPTEKKYGISFIGKYYDYRDRLSEIENYPAEKKTRAKNLYNYMMDNPGVPIEEAFRITLEKFENKKPGDFTHSEYVAALHTIRDVGTAVKFYFREKVILEILEAGIELHVFSEQWKDSPFASYKNLIVHPEAEYTASLDIMAQSRISLNIMSWHKAGMTERIANAMLNKSLCLTDKTRYLEKEFSDGEDIVFFDIENLKVLPEIIKGLLDDDIKRKDIEQAAYKKALERHIWEVRAKELIDKINNKEGD
ncbi:MAG: glycosyltransferase [Eubacterium sp.]|nr:glycosyltransferase [Eubacterium sp.]